MKIDFSGFMGANTQIESLLLPDGVCTMSTNQAPGRGDLRSWRQPLTVANVPAYPQRKTIYRFGRSSDSEALHWLSWSTIVHAVRGFDREDTQERTYFTGAAGGPAWTDSTMAIATAPYPTSSRPLGMPAPVSAPTLSIAVAGSSSTQEERYFVTTFVNDIGWESGPSPAAVVTCNDDAKITLSNLEAAPSGNYGINRRRIYRTESGATGATEFFFEAEIAYTGAGQTWTETGAPLSTDVLATQTTLGGWLPCPSDATCLTQMWNGMAAVISGKTIRPCVANHIYAYPYDYEIALADQPVAMGVWGQNLLVLTNGRIPSLITGQDPSSLSEQPIDGLPFNGACRSVQSVVSMGHGVCWASPDGLAYIGSAGQKIITSGLIHPDDWRELKPETMVGATFMGLYFGFYNDGSGGWKGFAIDPISPSGVYWLTKGYQAAFTDPRTGSMFVLDSDGSVRKWDADTGGHLTVTARSKGYRTPSCNMGYGRVIASSYPVTLRLIADGETVASETVTDDDVFALPGGYEARTWHVEIEHSGKAVTSAHVAQSDEELFS